MVTRNKRRIHSRPLEREQDFTKTKHVLMADQNVLLRYKKKMTIASSRVFGMARLTTLIISDTIQKNKYK